MVLLFVHKRQRCGPHSMRGSRKYLKGEGVQLGVFCCYFLLMERDRVCLQLKLDHHRLASETPFNGASLTGRYWPNVEYWLGSFVTFQGRPWPVFLRNSIALGFSRVGGGTGPNQAPPLRIRACIHHRTLTPFLDSCGSKLPRSGLVSSSDNLECIMIQ